MGNYDSVGYKIFLITFWGTILFKVIEKNNGNFVFTYFLFISLVVLITMHLIYKIIKEDEKYKLVGLKYENDEEFFKLYNELYNKFNNYLTKLHREIKIECSLIFIMIFMSIGMLILNNKFYFMPYIAALYILIDIGYKILKYYSAYKNNIVINFIKLIDERLEFNKNINRIDLEEHFTEANFELDDYSIINFDDCIEGYIDNNLIVFSDVILSKIIEVDRKFENKKVFEGTFVKIDLEKETNLELRIKKNKNKVEEFINRDKNRNSNKKVELDSFSFEECFDVYTDNKIDTMRILTHDVMDTLVKFSKYNIDFEIVLLNDHLYFKFCTGNLFNPILKKKPMNIDVLYTYYCLFSFIYTLTRVMHVELKEYIV